MGNSNYHHYFFLVFAEINVFLYVFLSLKAKTFLLREYSEYFLKLDGFILYRWENSKLFRSMQKD